MPESRCLALPAPGEVIRYAYLWTHEVAEGREEARKDRPCAVVITTEWLLTKTIEAGRASGAVTPRSLSEIAVDTTVMEKAIAHPTDSRLYEKARRSLVALASQAGVALRQN